ncbi:CBO0543 family protein [Sutcliffiella sp. BMC8]|uniref:CBO0543 family protein n=1 Tax=Sutcliffiella sp. BMC8 TaxID=3073243 RepID=UPI0030CE74E5
MKEKSILILSVLISILLFFIAAKRNLRRSVVVLLFVQTYTWISGLLVAEFNLIKYPVKILFKKSYKGSFEYEHIVFPAYCVLFCKFYPHKMGKLTKTVYYSGFTSFITFLEIFAVRKTNTIKLIHWNLWMSALTIAATFFFTVSFEKWFFKLYSSEKSSNVSLKL